MQQLFCSAVDIAHTYSPTYDLTTEDRICRAQLERPTHDQWRTETRMSLLQTTEHTKQQTHLSSKHRSSVSTVNVTGLVDLNTIW